MNTQRVSYDISRNAKLWEVDDTFIDNPHSKFHKEHSALIEVTVEQWGMYQFDQMVKLPRELVEFVNKFTASLGIIPSQFTDATDVADAIIHRIDYEEPYFFLVDMLVNITHEEFTHTYRHRKTGDVLNPGRIEIFELNPKWDFKPYHVVRSIMEHPETVAFLNGSYVPPKFKDRDEALGALFSRISEVVWGKIGWLEDMVEQALDGHVENMVYDERRNQNEHSHGSITSAMTHDGLFWLAGALATITWLKSPAAVPFITDFHVVYDRLLCVNDNGTVSPWPESGGKVVVDGVDVYTMKQLECLPHRKPDTCACCGAAVHCTKELNITSLMHPTCSCGETLDPTDPDTVYSSMSGQGKHNGRNCQEYREKYPARTGFVCQRCIFMTINKMGDHTKCGRTICPAVSCPHHMGNMARVAALTHQRTKQLTAPHRG